MLANIPATQTVIEIRAPGGPEMLVPSTRSVPEPKDGEVLVRIAAAGINRADCLQRMGRYPMPPGAPDIPGLECSGTVVKLGGGVTDWRVGDQVCALMIGDGYGEYAAVPAVQCLPVPAGVGLIDAGGLPETFCTVWTNVFERMRLQAGEVFLVQGGSSGIGVTAIQLAKALGPGCWRLRARMRNAGHAATLAPMSRSTIARRILLRWVRNSPTAAVSIRSSTWSAATTYRGNSTCWRMRAGSVLWR
jgi:D-arabinose 1-dehydrogenase-like Zn-dependent alcohol dehydrogenase